MKYVRWGNMDLQVKNSEGVGGAEWLLVGFGPKPVIDREELEASILGKQRK